MKADEWVLRGIEDYSFDGRYFGTVKREQILGKAESKIKVPMVP